MPKAYDAACAETIVGHAHANNGHSNNDISDIVSVKKTGEQGYLEELGYSVREKIEGSSDCGASWRKVTAHRALPEAAILACLLCFVQRL